MDVSRVYRTGTHAKICALQNGARGTLYAAMYGEYSRVKVATTRNAHHRHAAARRDVPEYAVTSRQKTSGGMFGPGHCRIRTAGLGDVFV